MQLDFNSSAGQAERACLPSRRIMTKAVIELAIEGLSLCAGKACQLGKRAGKLQAKQCILQLQQRVKELQMEGLQLSQVSLHLVFRRTPHSGHNESVGPLALP